jgi:RNA polymerase-binding transcription factor DksA
MASASKKSLVSRAGAAARKVVSSGSAKKAATKKAAPVSKAPAKKSPATKAAAKKAPAKKAPVKKAPVKKAPVKKATAKKSAPVQKTAARKAPATNAPAKKAATTKAPAKKAPVNKATATKATAKKSAAVTRAAATKKAATKAPAKKAPATKAPAKKAASAAKLVVLEVEDPWTKQELAQVRKHLNDDVARLTAELSEVEGDLAGMIENSGEGAGHDQADVGSASFERDQEMVIVNNARDMLVQSQHALERIADGSYGQCEICGHPIGKNRLMAFPRATLCLSCKQREERR